MFPCSVFLHKSVLGALRFLTSVKPEHLIRVRAVKEKFISRGIQIYESSKQLNFVFPHMLLIFPTRNKKLVHLKALLFHRCLIFICPRNMFGPLIGDEMLLEGRWRAVKAPWA